ncbi:MAG: hypothetical protein Q9217_000517, partial [Psora testacea]
YEFYYDVILRGQYTFHIRTLHVKYGPIIRINPYELHISDPAFYDVLYASSASGEKRNKWEWYTKQFGTPQAMFSTTGHDQHKARRATLNRFFSKASVRRLQPIIAERVQALVQRLRGFKDIKAGVINVDHAFAAFANDIVMEYSYGRSDHRVDQKDFAPDYHDAALEAGKRAGILKQMIWIYHLMQSLPEWLAILISPSFDSVLRIKRQFEQQIAQIKAKHSSTSSNLPHPTIFHEILQSQLCESDKSLSRLTDEAMIIVAAGTMTTSWALSVSIYHLLASPRILTKLKAELRSAIPDPGATVSLSMLEKLPYLAAVVQEAVRLSYGVASRLQRISPDKSLLFTDADTGKQWSIPPNTPVGMTSIQIHQDESIFPDARSFVPERWIENPRLDRYMVSFCKGSRQCIGINLAYAEMYLCLAAIFRRFGSGGENSVRTEGDEGILELFETGPGDVEVQADGFVPLAAKDSQGIRIRVRS